MTTTSPSEPAGAPRMDYEAELRAALGEARGVIEYLLTRCDIKPRRAAGNGKLTTRLRAEYDAMVKRAREVAEPTMAKGSPGTLPACVSLVQSLAARAATSAACPLCGCANCGVPDAHPSWCEAGGALRYVADWHGAEYNHALRARDGLAALDRLADQDPVIDRAIMGGSIRACGVCMATDPHAPGAPGHTWFCAWAIGNLLKGRNPPMQMEMPDELAKLIAEGKVPPPPG
jgi:hypothetical protein